jgi:hypothetical protein
LRWAMMGVKSEWIKDVRKSVDVERSRRIKADFLDIEVLLDLQLAIYCIGACGGAVVEALRCKPEGRGIDSRWCHWNFSLT